MKKTLTAAIIVLSLALTGSGMAYADDTAGGSGKSAPAAKQAKSHPRSKPGAKAGRK